MIVQLGKKTISTLQNLVTELKPYGEKEDLGNYKSIIPQAYNKIETIFDEAVVSTNAFLKESANNNNIEDDTRIKSNANFNKEFLSKAYTEFKNVNVDNVIILEKSGIFIL